MNTDLSPVFRLEFTNIISWNNVLSNTRFSRVLYATIKEWREIGKQAALAEARKRGFEVEEVAERKKKPVWKKTSEKVVTKTGKVRTKSSRKKIGENIEVVYCERIYQPVFKKPVALVIRLWRHNADYDVYNLFTKSLIDGIVDANLLPDDSVKWLPEVRLRFEGVDETLKISGEERARRKKNISENVKNPPLPCRVYFDFYYADELQ